MPTATSPSTALLRIERPDSTRLETALGREWLETDGLGGFASSTIVGCPTRRYHGLLVARPPGHARRHVFLARLEETLVCGGARFPLSIARYPGAWAPAGHAALESFELAPHPRARYCSGPIEVLREVVLVHGAPQVLVRWRVHGPQEGLALELRPMLAFREADALTFENPDLDPGVERLRAGVRVRPYAGLPALALTLSPERFEWSPEPRWYRSIEYAEDLRRGYPGHEDHFSPGVFRVPLEGEREVVLAATIDGPVSEPARLFAEVVRERAAALDRALESQGTVQTRMELAADAFLVRSTEGRPGVIAGYPWFGEWGRDTFLALPGLTLARGRMADCREVLLAALEHLRDGLLPNVYGEGPGEANYGSADAALWFARAVFLLERAGAPREGIRSDFRPALRSIAEAYLEGASLSMRVDEGGLLQVGEAELNATWMDARTDEGPVTPRHGCPVEIEALWYQLLAHLEELEDGPRRKSVGALRRRAKRSFLERFWLEDGRYLADVWRDGATDRSVRPNQVVAAALEQSPLTRAARADVVACAKAELLTPFGLRTLSPADSAYRGRYGGAPDERDRAYHQGTAWPWLLGFFCEASLRGRGVRKRDLRVLAGLWSALEDELDHRGLGHLSEVFDGDAPHRAGGTIAQAWNTAEWLRSAAMLARGRP